jgi:nucleotide-binding universal stress UspA family protein
MYATIFIYFSSPKTAEVLAKAGVQLANRYGAHLIGAHNSASVSLYGGLPSEVLSQFEASQRKDAAAVEEVFTRTAQAANVSYEWRHHAVKDTQLIDDIIGQARAADLVIACGNDEADRQVAFQNVPVRLALETGRPVLLVPTTADSGPIGERVGVAWSSSRESGRAVFDALPLLKAAHAVTVISVKTSDAGPAEPGKDIAAALTRHGVKVETAVVRATDRSEGAELLATAEARECDLVVMGLYGHSKLRQMVLGGVTSYILSHPTIPLLVAH